MKKNTFLLIIGILFLAAGGLGFRPGGGDPLYRLILGKPFSLAPREIHLENRQPGTEEIVTVGLTNRSRKEISVVGERTTCVCASADNIPITVKPGETAEVHIRVSLPEHQADYNQTVVLMIAASDKLVMEPVRITASVSSPLPEPESAGLSAEPPSSPDTPPEQAPETESGPDSSPPDNEGPEPEPSPAAEPE